MSSERLRSRIDADERLVGTVATTADPSLLELIAKPLDFVWVDLEHGSLDVSAIPPLAIAATAADCHTLVRIPEPTFPRLPAILDSGVEGVVVPRLETAEQAAVLARRLRYPPSGTRGYGPRRAGDYGRLPYSQAASAPYCVVQIESRAAVACASEIASNDGIDALVIGTADLSFELGTPLELTSREMRKAVQEVRAAARSAQTAFGLAVPDLETLAVLGDATDTFAVISIETRILARAIDQLALETRNLELS